MSILIGKKAPSFTTQAVVNKKVENPFSLDRYKGKHILFFFYPLDFTFVCPTELHAFQDKIEDFKKRETELIACSVDSVYTHLAWLNTPRNKGGIEGITYPIISDINKTIARDFGVLYPEEGVAYRGLFLIDTKGIVRHQVVNDLPLGRSVDEALRVIDALIFVEKNGEVCPANWREGARAMTPTQEGLEKYFTAHLNP